ncbi:MAG: PGF-pre-PGF domain-containing protein [archaeon]
MVKTKFIFLLSIFILLSISGVFAFDLNGTTYTFNRVALNNTNISVTVQDQTFTEISVNTSNSNSTGNFNLSLADDITYMYQLLLWHHNGSMVDYVAKPLPTLPYSEFSQLRNVNFYLFEAGTINITAVNRTGDLIPNSQFTYSVKDTKLGYPISNCMNSGSKEVVCYLQKDRNYSIMIYPADGSPEHFVPVSFDWNNFSSTSNYTTGLSNYIANTRTFHKQFNVSESFIRISGYITEPNIEGWDDFSIIPYLQEPGGMIFMSMGFIPFNASSWNSAQSDYYNNYTGFYNITVPYSTSETVEYMFYAAARNGSTYYGGFKNITNPSHQGNFNISMYGLLGINSTINQTRGDGLGSLAVNTKKQSFYFVNSSGFHNSVTVFVDVKVDYSAYGSREFTFMEDVGDSGISNNFSIPLLNVTGIKEINIFSSTFAPRRIPTKTAAQISANNNITLTAFNPADIDGADISSSLTIKIYQSNSTCDVPEPSAACLITSTTGASNFNPISAVMGGGQISFRMGLGGSGIEIHYVNVDMLASGPPDGLFDDSANTAGTSGTSFNSVLRFGSKGPKIYDYILMSIPYSETAGSGLNDSAPVNMSIPTFYDEDWNTIWLTSTNGTNASNLASNDTHYAERQDEWQQLMVSKACTTSVAIFNATTPCFISTSSNKIWIRLPHFSGTGPRLTGTVLASAASGDDDSSSSSSSSSGGDDEQATSNKKVKSWTLMESDKSYTMNIDSSVFGLDKIEIEVGSNTSNAKITLYKYDEKPGAVSEKLGKVYKYIQIFAENLDNNMTKSILTLQVNKSWVDTNTNKNSISLYRYNSATSSWDNLNASYSTADSGNYYYKVNLKSFSFFAIATPDSAASNASSGDVNSTTVGTDQESGEDGQSTSIWIWILGIIIVVIIITIIIFGALEYRSRMFISKRKNN